MEEGFVALTELEQHDRQVAMRVWKFWGDPESFPKLRCGFVALSGLRQTDTQVVVITWIWFGPRLHRSRIGRNCTGPVPFLGQGVTEVKVDFPTIRAEVDRLAKLGDGFIDLSLHHQGIAKPVMSNSVVRRIGQSVSPDRLTIPPSRSL